MSNSYYNHSTFPGPFAPGASANLRQELQLITDGFDKLPILAGNAGLLVRVNATADGLEVTGTLAGYTFSNVTITSGTVSGIALSELTSPLAVASGGTSRSTLTLGALLRGAGAGPVEFLSPGAVGNVLQSDGTSWVGGPAPVTTTNTLVVDRRTSNTMLASGDRSKLILVTSGTFTQTLDTAVNVGPDWYVLYKNAGTGDVTLAPTGGQLIDGLASYICYSNEMRIIYRNAAGDGFESQVLEAFDKTYLSSGTFIKPPGYPFFYAEVQAAGGGGGSGRKSVTDADIAGGGGGAGGACIIRAVKASEVLSSASVTVGAGGAGGAAIAAGGGSADGNNGSLGGGSAFSDVITTNVGGSGSGGSTAGSVAGGNFATYFSGFAAAHAQYVISGSGGLAGAGAFGTQGQPTSVGGSGGGAGGGCQSGGSGVAGGASIGRGFIAGAAAGITNGASGVSGTYLGMGGGGGAGGTGVNGGDGGNGGPGGGGGGGGACVTTGDTFRSGAGGNGGNGYVSIRGIR